MPKCHKCLTTLATAEMRRTTKGHVCKDKIGCQHDRAARLKGESPGPRSLQRLLRF